MLRVYKTHIGPARKIKEKFVTKIKITIKYKFLKH